MKNVWYIAVVEFYAETIIQGVIVNGKSKGLDQLPSSIFGHLSNVVGSYFKTIKKASEFVLYLNGNIHLIKADKYGSFKLKIAEKLKEKPEIKITYKGKVVEFNSENIDYFPYKNSAFDIISDLDDTVYVSNTANFFKRVGTVTFVPSSKRKIIYFSQKLISIINNENPNLYFVSKSEYNLLPIILHIFKLNALPKGILFLTLYLNFKGLITVDKDVNFKVKTIKFILKYSNPNKKFILFGDDTQKDMEVYEVIAKEFKNRIAKIYIHQTKAKVNTRKLRLWDKLKTTFPNSVYFNEDSNIDEELKLLSELISKK